MIVKCTKCLKDLSPENFGKERAKRNGLKSHCKECRNAYGKKWRLQNVDKVKENNKKYRQMNPEKIKKELKKWNEKNRDKARAQGLKNYKKNTDAIKKRVAEYKLKNPEKKKAQHAVYNAIRSGKLKKKPCEVCGDLKVDAHHESYSPENWLNVVWLCRLHHKKRHKEMKN